MKMPPPTRPNNATTEPPRPYPATAWHKGVGDLYTVVAGKSRAYLKASDERGDNFGAIGFSGEPSVHDGDEDEKVSETDGAESKAHDCTALECGEEALGGGANAANANADVGLDGGHHADVAAQHLGHGVRHESWLGSSGSLKLRSPKGKRMRLPIRWRGEPAAIVIRGEEMIARSSAHSPSQ